jgi:hypothetical protein
MFNPVYYKLTNMTVDYLLEQSTVSQKNSLLSNLAVGHLQHKSPVIRPYCETLQSSSVSTVHSTDACTYPGTRVMPVGASCLKSPSQLDPILKHFQSVHVKIYVKSSNQKVMELNVWLGSLSVFMVLICSYK